MHRAALITYVLTSLEQYCDVVANKIKYIKYTQYKIRSIICEATFIMSSGHLGQLGHLGDVGHLVHLVVKVIEVVNVIKVVEVIN